MTYASLLTTLQCRKTPLICFQCPFPDSLRPSIRISVDKHKHYYRYRHINTYTHHASQSIAQKCIKPCNGQLNKCGK